MEGEPVLAFVGVRNLGSDAFRDLALLDPSAGNLRLRVFSGENRLRILRPSFLGYGAEGPQLESGGCACEIVDLKYWFGLRSGPGASPRIPPGIYQVSASLSARLGFTRLPQVRIASDTASFRVVTSTMPAGFLTYDSLLQTSEGQLSTAKVLEMGQSIKAGPVHIAALVNHRVRTRRIGDAAKREWIASLRSMAESEEVRCVLDTMDRKIRYKVHYTSYGP